MKNLVTFGEIMLRLSAPDYLRFSQTQSFDSSYGGAEANLAISLANFGMPCSFVTRLPKNDIGKSALLELKQRDINIDHIIWGGERLGVYFLETGAVARPSKVIYDRAYSSMSQIQPGMIDWDKVFKDSDWFHWSGITPAISQSAAEVCLEALKVAKSKKLTISVDLNYRSKLWKYGKSALEVMPELVDFSDIILGHGEAAEKCLGIKINHLKMFLDDGDYNINAFLDVGNQIMNKFPHAKKIATSLRKPLSSSHHILAGAIYDGEKMSVAPAQKITHIVDRIGGGDAFMAGLIYGLRAYKDNQKSIDFAVAASCLKHTIRGDVNLVTVDEVESLVNNGTEIKVSR